MMAFRKTLALGSTIAMLGGCGVSALKEAQLPEGETNLSCAALIYAATNLVEGKDDLNGEGRSLSDYVAVMTKYGTAHAKSKGIEDGNQVLGIVKVEAYAMTGRTPGRSMVLSDDGVKKRAKACYGE